ncbi:penicillin-binding transpeptidase domain-containing protein [Petrocella sp. FN5]|uniref:penicillin-binding transpeptidase domain-containing protein n=1 Tax=Petrocella sp. FN5 TaxID=3032002 RepID=UPI0023DBB526|nr:penicillin-binding transpeptidase domain-containing protein [Petrocella sp. FN5]MDF1616324.1 penicillin-binding transpeptidase domain-containing protein [Petrocella sp. FN5]
MKTLFKAIYSFLTHRLFLLLLIVFVLFYILVMRLFELQIVEGEALAKAFELSVIREVSIEGHRGNIYDRNGYPLAENIISYTVFLNDSIEVPDKNQMIHELIGIIRNNGDALVDEFPLRQTEDGFEIIGTEKQILNFKKNVFNLRYTSQLTEEQIAMEPYEIYLFLRDQRFNIDAKNYTTAETLDILNVRYAQYIKRYSKYQPEVIATNVSQKTLAVLEERNDIFPGVSIVETPYRVYNDAPYFAHIIGYTRKIDSERLEVLKPLGYTAEDTIGVIGIEKEMESHLRGYDGAQKVEVNNLGKTMLVIDNIDPIMGYDVYLTIDRDLQINTYNILERQLAEIIVDRMLMRLPNTREQRYILLKDIYDSIFRYDLIDTRLINPENSDGQTRIYNTMVSTKDQMASYVINEIKNDTPPQNYNKYGTIYTYFLENLRTEGILDKGYRSDENFVAFKKGQISFRILMTEFYKANLLILPEALKDAGEEEAFAYVIKFIEEESATRYDFTKYIYMYLLDQEAFSYYDLTFLILDFGLVTATEEDIINLKSRRLAPIDFMKQKILNIEITPHQLALDPSSGAVVVTDVDTGEVLALVSYPSYDNSRLVNNFDNNYYAKLLSDPTSPLYPRATYAKSVPGSTFKMVTAIAALEEGIIRPTDRVLDRGIFTKIFPSPSCWIYNQNRGSHGSINVIQAIEHSCNYFFYEMGWQLSFNEDGRYSDAHGISVLADYASRFGLDSKTGIEIGEASSTLAERDAVRATIGQGTHDFTPVQLARYMNTLANNGKMQELNVVDKVMNKSGEVIVDYTPKTIIENDFNQNHIDVVKKGMLEVTEGSSGTARSYFADFPISIAGKTGTAELIKSRASHAIFTGFAPYDDPTVSIATVIHFGYSSRYAALNSKKVLAMYFEVNKEAENYTTGNKLN